MLSRQVSRILLVFLLMGLVSAVGVNNPNLPLVQNEPLAVTFDNTTGATVNSSEIWITNEGNFDNLADTYATLNTQYLEIDGGNSPTANINWGGFDITNVNNIEFDSDGKLTFFDGYIWQSASADIEYNADNVHRFLQNINLGVSGSTKTIIGVDGSATFNVEEDSVDFIVNSDEVPNMIHVDASEEEVSFQNGAITFETGLADFGSIPITTTGTATAGYNIVRQTADVQGISVFGYDDKSAYSFNLNLDANGYSRFLSSLQMQFRSDAGHISFFSGAGSYIYLDSNSHIYNDLGDSAGAKYFYIRNSGGTAVASVDSLGNAKFSGDVNVTKNFTGNQIYGEMWYHNHTGTTLDFASASTWYPMFFINATSLNGFDFVGGFGASSNLTAQLSGKYKASYRLSGSGQNNHIYMSTILINDVDRQNCADHKKMASGGDIVPMGSSGCFVNLIKGDNVSVAVMDYGGTGTGNYYSGNLNLVRVGD